MDYGFYGTARSAWSRLWEGMCITCSVVFFIGIKNILFEIQDRCIFVTGNLLESKGYLVVLNERGGYLGDTCR